jgi:hypothetical protein
MGRTASTSMVALAFVIAGGSGCANLAKHAPAFEAQIQYTRVVSASSNQVRLPAMSCLRDEASLHSNLQRQWSYWHWDLALRLEPAAVSTRREELWFVTARDVRDDQFLACLLRANRRGFDPLIGMQGTMPLSADYLPAPAVLFDGVQVGANGLVWGYKALATEAVEVRADGVVLPVKSAEAAWAALTPRPYVQIVHGRVVRLRVQVLARGAAGGVLGTTDNAMSELVARRRCWTGGGKLLRQAPEIVVRRLARTGRCGEAMPSFTSG